MWNHWPAMASAMETLEMQPPTFRGSDLADLFAYLFFARYDGQPGSPARGRNLYTTSHCASCHGVSGAGGVGPALREFTGREPKEALLQRMWNHAPGMSWQMGIHKIPWPRLEPQQLADLMAYLATGLDERGDSR
jgi:mono/diheme cytochrome c family protein